MLRGSLLRAIPAVTEALVLGYLLPSALTSRAQKLQQTEYLELMRVKQKERVEGVRTENYHVLTCNIGGPGTD